jgi:hypothetical protein
MTTPLVFTVTAVTSGTAAMQLTGHTSTLSLTTLTLRTTGNDNRRISKTSTVASIHVSASEFALVNPAPATPFDLILNVTDNNDGTLTVESIGLSPQALVARSQSDIRELAGTEKSATGTDRG